jgi:multidrug efflux system membrane fusion protein
LVGALVIGLVVWAATRKRQGAETGGGRAARQGPGADGPVPVIAGTVQRKDLPVYLDGLGTVQAFNTVTVRSRVDGQIQRIGFVEGQEVHAGDLLAQLDPAPFQAQLDQSVAKKAQDEAQLAIAKTTLERDAELLRSKILAQQDYDMQKAVVRQLEAALKADDATINNATTQLGYTTITAPIDGRTGIRLVDVGNIVHATDSNGLVVVTQMRPISIVFTLPEQNLAAIQEHMGPSAPLQAFALDRDNHAPFAEGKLAVIDNQIDTSTGTLRLKATFPNTDSKLWPGQFVNVRLLLEMRKDATVVPASVVQRGPEGAFAYVISNDVAVVRPVQVAFSEGDQVMIEAGLTPGEHVVVDGQYKLQPGAKVKPSEGGTGTSGRSLSGKAGQRPTTNSEVANPTQLQDSNGQ